MPNQLNFSIKEDISFKMATTSTEAGSTSQSVHDTDTNSSVALSSHEDSSSEQDENDGTPKLTQKWLLAFFSKDWKHYYRTFELNERLYLHFKGKNFARNFPEIDPGDPFFRLRQDPLHGAIPRAEDPLLRG